MCRTDLIQYLKAPIAKMVILRDEAIDSNLGPVRGKV